MRASYVKVTHDAKIRSQTAADKPGCSATLQAHRWSTTRCVSRDASRDRLGRALCVDARSILTFRVPDSPERIRCRHPAPRVMHWPFLSDQRNLSGRSAREPASAEQKTPRTSIYSRRNVVHWAHPQQRESGARRLGMATHKLPDSRPAVVSENARSLPHPAAAGAQRLHGPGDHVLAGVRHTQRTGNAFVGNRNQVKYVGTRNLDCRRADAAITGATTRPSISTAAASPTPPTGPTISSIGCCGRALREGADGQSRGAGAAVGPGPVSSALPGWRRR